MDTKHTFTTGEVADLIHVHQTTVIDWMDKGLMGGYRTPGGHRRIQREALLGFLQTQRMPIPSALRNNSSHTPPIGVEPERHVHETYQVNPYSTGTARKRAGNRNSR